MPTDRFKNLLQGLIPLSFLLLFQLALPHANEDLQALYQAILRLSTLILITSCFLVIWNSKNFLTNHFFVILTISLFSSSILHLFSLSPLQDRHELGQIFNTEMGLHFWIAARLMFALTLIYATFNISKKYPLRLIISIYPILTGILIIILFQSKGQLAPLYRAGLPLANFHLLEAFLTLLFFSSMFLLLGKKRYFDVLVFDQLLLFIFLFALGDLTYWLAHGFGQEDLFSWIHAIHFLGAHALYRAIVQIGLQSPYRLLFHELYDQEEQQKKALQVELDHHNEISHKTEVQLAQLWKQQQTLLETVNALGLEVGGKLALWNNRLLDLFGYSEWDMSTKGFLVFLADEEQKTCFQNQAIPAVVNGDLYKGEFQFKNAQGRVFWGELRGKAIDPLDMRQGIIWEVEDIDIQKKANKERRQLEHQLRHTQKMEALGTLAGGIAHDFNNILQGIMIGLDVALWDLKDDHPSKEQLHEVLKFCHRGKDLVHQILGFSRKETLEKPQFIELVPILEEALSMLSSIFTQRVRIQKKYKREKSTFLGVSNQIHQVIVNLCSNAEQAMRDIGGTITIGLEDIHFDAPQARVHGLHEGRFLRLAIEDTGPGIPNKLQERIFEPFFTTKKKGEGTGMGLSIVHGIIKSHHGTIQLHKSDSSGSCFHVYLPQVTHEPDALEAPTSQPIENPLQLLIIDDEKDVLALIKKMLTQQGHNAIIANDGRLALKYFKENPEGFDLIITDQTMPEMTGCELAKKLNKIKKIPILLITGDENSLTHQMAQECKLAGILSKPFGAEELNLAIRNCLKLD